MTNAAAAAATSQAYKLLHSICSEGNNNNEFKV